MLWYPPHSNTIIVVTLIKHKSGSPQASGAGNLCNQASDHQYYTSQRQTSHRTSGRGERCFVIIKITSNMIIMMEVPPNSLIAVKERGSPTTTTWGGGTLGGVGGRRSSVQAASTPSTRSSQRRRTTSMPLFHQYVATGGGVLNPGHVNQATRGLQEEKVRVWKREWMNQSSNLGGWGFCQSALVP